MVGKIGEDKDNEKDESKKEEIKKEPISRDKPVVIEPVEDKQGTEKPKMPELKGEPSKKIERKKKIKKIGLPAKQSKLAAGITILSFILLTFGVSIVVLPMYGIALPKPVEPAIEFLRDLPIFPEKGKVDKTAVEEEAVEETPVEPTAGAEVPLRKNAEE